MRFIISNFGPVREANITIKPLTVFIGSNASGKSYIAYLIWCLLTVEPNWDRLVEIIDKYLGDITELNDKRIGDRVKKIILSILRDFINIFYKENLEDLLEDTFLIDDLRELIRYGANEAKVILSNDKGSIAISINITKDGLIFYNLSNEVIGMVEQTIKVKTEPIVKETIRVVLEVDGNEWIKEDVTDREELVDLIIKMTIAVISWLFDGYFPHLPSVIIPDGRAGLLRAREAMVHTLMSIRWRPLIINAADTAFIRTLESLNLRVRSKEINKITTFIEKKLQTQFVLHRMPPRYIVKFKDVEMPLQRTSSGIREIAPIVFILRHYLSKGYFLIVEEPESHLHPDAQVIITRALAGLPKQRVVTLMTTHSIHVLDEISNLIRLRKLSDEEKKRLGYEVWEGLDPEDVAVYLFTSDGRVESIGVSDDGLEETGLDRVVIEIANIQSRVENLFRRKR